MNRLFGLIVLGLAGAVGFGSISGCPAKKTDTSKPVVAKSSGDKLTLTVPGEVTLATDKDKGTFEVKIKRESPLEGEATITISGAPDGVMISADPNPIPKDKDTSTATVTLDKAKAKAGTYDITVTVKVKEEEAKAKMKLVLTSAPKDGGAQTAKPFTLAGKPAELDVDISKEKTSFDVSVTREGHTGPVALKYKGIPAGVTFQGDSIPADKDSVTVNVLIDKTAAKAGTSEVMVDAHIGESKAEAPLKLKLK